MSAKMKRLDHVNLRTGDLDAMIAWYGRILDMHPGPRPDFGFPGAWLYAAGLPVVHLVGHRATPAAGPDAIRIEHFAMTADGLKDFLSVLKAEGVPAHLAHVRDFGIVQVNIHDPDGNHIHIDFEAAEAEGVET
jgi:catechol 2,3-dioxygenase-like lactoylglutathione lyase family enzyme